MQGYAYMSSHALDRRRKFQVTLHQLHQKTLMTEQDTSY